MLCMLLLRTWSYVKLHEDWLKSYSNCLNDYFLLLLFFLVCFFTSTWATLFWSNSSLPWVQLLLATLPTSGPGLSYNSSSIANGFLKQIFRELCLTASPLPHYSVKKCMCVCVCMSHMYVPDKYSLMSLCSWTFSVCQPESGCLTHTPSSLLSRRRSSAILLTGSSLPARESSPLMSPLVMNSVQK